MMRVKLNIEEDDELRAYIKECIKGQVLSIVNDEVMSLIKTKLDQKLETMQSSQFDRLIAQAIQTSVDRKINGIHNIRSWDNGFIKPYIDSALEKVMKGKDLNKLVDEAAKIKLANLLNKQYIYNLKLFKQLKTRNLCQVN